MSKEKDFPLHKNGIPEHLRVLGTKGWYTKDGRLRGSEKPLPGKCGKHLRGSEPPRYCQNDCSKGRTTCILHGGKTPRGIASPHFKHGRHSGVIRHLPVHLQEAAQELRESSELVSLKDALTIQGVRAIELLDRLSETKDISKQLALALKALKNLRKAKDAEATNEAMDELETVLEEGVDSSKMLELTWLDLRALVQEQTKTVAVEHKRAIDARMVLTQEQAVSLMVAILAILKQEIKDEPTLRKVNEGILRLLPAPDKNSVIEAEVIYES